MKIFFKRLFINCQIVIMLIMVFYGMIERNVFAFENQTEDDLYEMYNWLIENQLSDGALPMYLAKDGDASIVPYFSSIATLAIMEYRQDEESLEAVESYYNWYFDHLNTDDDGLAGSIYDYKAEIKDKIVISEESKADYDSADSYAALFLMSLESYIKAGGDKDYIILHRNEIDTIINLILSLIDRDGLCRVSETNHTKYLMDNCEVAAGLNSAAGILSEIYLKEYSVFSKEFWNTARRIIDLRKTRKALLAAIESKMWNEDRQVYEIGIDKHDDVLEYDMDYDFYPDAVAQIFPIVFGVLSPQSQRSRQLYEDFSDKYKWEELEHYKINDSSFYWGITAYCGAIMSDSEKVNQYISSFVSEAAPEYRYPAYNADIAWVVLAGMYN